VSDVIVCVSFGVEKLRGLGNTIGQILGSPIEMAGHPYNSAACDGSCQEDSVQNVMNTGKVSALLVGVFIPLWGSQLN